MLLPLLACLLFGPPQTSILARYRFDAAPAWRVALPASMREASGLALYKGQVVVHGDEEASLLTLNPRTGAPTGAYRFGSAARAQHGDFEAVAAYGDRLVLLRSDGDLFIGTPDSAGRRTPLLHRRTKLGHACEFEAMVVRAATDDALLLCKEMYGAPPHGDRNVYRVSLADTTSAATLAFTIDGRALRRVTGLDGFRPSDATLVGATGHLILLAAVEHALVEIDAQGTPIAGAVLPRKRHPQAEGLLLLPDGTLLIADEGQGGPARLAAYAPVP